MSEAEMATNLSKVMSRLRYLLRRQKAGEESTPANALRRAAERQIRAGSPALRRFLRHKLGMVSVGVLSLLVLMAIFAPLICRQGPYELELTERNAPPSREHILGCDNVGRDMWARLIYGARVSLSVGVFAVSISTVIAILVGGASGFFGGVVDMLVMRFTDIVMCFPFFLLIITLATMLKPSVINIILIIGLTGWTGMSRLVRAQILSVKEEDYVLAARSVGVPTGRILLRHVIPNALTPVLVSAPMRVAGAIMAEAGLSFLGVGVQDPMPSWGNMMTNALSLPILKDMPSRWLPPAVMLALITLSVNFAGDALRDALDPKTRPR